MNSFSSICYFLISHISPNNTLSIYCINRRKVLYQTSNVKRIAPSRQATCWSQSIQKIRKVMNTKNAQSLYTSFFWIRIGATIAESHRMNHRLKILDPITFQTDNDQLQLSAAIHERNSSGADVPIASTVSPIRSADTLKYCAILTLVLIRWLAEYQSKISQIMSRIVAKNISKY